MSSDESKVLLEGFLKKRKDTMKMKWATYWFRLQHTTLFFYTKKEGHAVHLRGLYYIYTVQSVQEVPRDEGKRFVFELIMTNGKKKVLAAETAALRKEWVAQLWKAIKICTPWKANPCSSTCVSDLRPRVHSGTHRFMEHHSMTEAEDGRSHSAPTTLVRGPHDLEGDRDGCNLSLSFSDELHSEEAIYQNSPNWIMDTQVYRDSEELQENDYDILPPRNSMYISQSPGEQGDREGHYAVPRSNRRVANHQENREMSESIYDVPRSMRKLSEHTLEPLHGGEIEMLVDGGGLLEDMMASLGRGAGAWMSAAPGCKEPL